MRLLLLCLLLTGCASGDWEDYNYGPGDWLNENGYGTWDTMYNYKRLIEPKITIHTVEDTAKHCGNSVVKACTYLRIWKNTCDVYVTERVSEGLMAHEIRHCHGWLHYEPDYRLWYSMTPEERQRAAQRTSAWYPHPELQAEYNATLP